MYNQYNDRHTGGGDSHGKGLHSKYSDGHTGGVGIVMVRDCTVSTMTGTQGVGTVMVRDCTVSTITGTKEMWGQ